MARISMQDLIARYQLSPDQLDKELSEEHLREVSRIIDNHNIVGPELGLSKADMTAINSDASTQELRRLEMLRRWKQNFAWKATYRRLIEALLKCGRADTATTVCELLAPDVSSKVPPAAAAAVACHSAISHPTHRGTGGTGCEPASQSAKTARSGRNTPEYQRVRSNLSSITRALQLNPTASQTLRQKFKQEGWLGLTASPTEEKLVTLVLGRIELNANQYGEFVAMLHDIDGMDLIVNTLTAPPSSAQLPPSLPTMSDSETKPRLAMKDMVTLCDYLFELEKEQIRTLGLILGLHSTTLSNKWESSRNDYLDDVLKAWLRRQDDVEEKGAPSWATLATALEHRRLQQNGIANKIRKERLYQ